MLNNDYVEEISEILYQMQLQIDRANELLSEDLPKISVTPPELSFKDSVVVPYVQGLMEIMEDDKRLGWLKVERTGPGTAQIRVRVGNQMRQSPHISLEKGEEAFLEYFTLIMAAFFPTHIINFTTGV